MTTTLTGGLETKTEHPLLGQSIWLRLTITNSSGQAAIIVNPDVGHPPSDLAWQASRQAYQMAVLMSYGLIKITLTDVAGQPVESQDLAPWVTPILSQQTLQPGETLGLDFDLNELFSLDEAGLYQLWLRYGDDTVKAEAQTDIEIAAWIKLD